MMRESGPLLVALDGSELGEKALPYARALAVSLGERIVLFTAWEGTDNSLGETLPSLVIDVEKQADAHFREYLNGVAAKITGVDVDVIVRPGEPGAEIIKAAGEVGARAIALSTHGRSGVGRWLYGSTASHLLHHAEVPLIVCGPNVPGRETGSDVALKHMMLPLDGSELGEAAIPIANGLARRIGCRVSLVRGVPWAVQAYPYSLPSTYVPQIDEQLEEGAKAYLRKCETMVEGVEAKAFVVRGAVADGLIEFVEREGVDLIVMTTHARSGLARMALGSTADRMLQAPAPALLIRPEALG
jgi:nucleotide-binding universal stress UspA family protein